MDCPHCGEENLLGAVSCMACGKSLFDVPGSAPGATGSGTALVGSRAPPPRDSDATLDPGGGPSAARMGSEGLPRCRVCLEPFDRSSRDPTGDTCPSCRRIASQGGDAGQNQVQFAPQPEMSAEYLQRLGSKTLRPSREMNVRVGLRKGPVAVLVGIVLVLVGLAVVKFAPRSDRFASQVADVARTETRVIR